MAGTIIVDTINSSVASTPPVFQANGTQIGTLCRAWVNFNGTGTVAIRASFNVSSITDNGTGDYTVNFTTAMPDVNYAPFTSARSYQDFDDNGIFTFPFLNHTNTTSAFRFIVAHKDAGSSSGNTPFDSTQVNVSVFR